MATPTKNNEIPDYSGPDMYDVLPEAGYPSGDLDIPSLYEGIIKDATFNSQYRHELQQSQMEWLKELNKREYNEGLRDEERAYNSPTALLGRLMATGMSRQAAMQLLSSMSGGSGGAAAPYSSSTPQGQSAASDSAEFANIAKGVSDSINSIGGLINAAGAGINVNNLARQSELLKSNVFSSDLQTQAIKDVNGLISALYSKDGARPNYDEISTAEGLVTWCQDPAREKDNPELFKFMSSPAARSIAGNVFAHSLLDDTFIKHTNARREEMANAAMLRGQILFYQKECSRFDMLNSEIQLDKNQIEFEHFKDLDPLDFDRRLKIAKYDLELIKQTKDPETLKYVVSKVKDDAFFNACVSSIRRQCASFMSEKYINSPEWQNAINMVHLLDTIGFTGEIGNVVKLGAMLGGGITAPNGQGDQTLDKLTDAFKKVYYFDPLGDFFKSIPKRHLPNPFNPTQNNGAYGKW